jgi:imidazolonepropionase-like amidohydrolase
MTEAGMPILEALKTATVTNAKVLEMQDQIGSIAVGKLADIIAVDENPETNVATLMNVTFVMKDGKVFKK